MKLFLTSLLLLFIVITSINAQTPALWGTTDNGGQSGGGNLFVTNSTGTNYKNLYSFQNQDAIPASSVIQATNGLLYGLTTSGGANNYGMIYSYDITSGGYTDLHDFTNEDGASPLGSLLQAKDSLLYGLTQYGGAFDSGVIFSYNIATGVETDLYDFTGFADGCHPKGSLIQGGNRLLYGLTYDGGTNDSGTVFSFNILTKNETVLHNFKGGTTDGGLPCASLLMINDSLLYGTTLKGGAYYNFGTIFNYNINSNYYVVLLSFDSVADGFSPIGTLIQASNGLLYGTTEYGGTNNFSGGTIFSYDISTNVKTIVYSFLGSLADGQFPQGTLVQASNGLLYGLTVTGGIYSGVNAYGALEGCGNMFSFNIDSNTYHIVHFFGNGWDGNSPIGSLIQASNGLLYASTQGGGEYGFGALINYNTISNIESSLFNFGSFNTGYSPAGQLLLASNGLLYGLNSYGGTYGYGTIYTYDIPTNTYTDVYNFGNGFDGKTPINCSLIQANNGLLYGGTYNGGTCDTGMGLLTLGEGTLFNFDINTNTETVLHNFGVGYDGAIPSGSLLQAKNGLLYGVTAGGGDRKDYSTLSDGVGTLYSYNITTGNYEIVHDFDHANDNYSQIPQCGLIQAKDGLLYGTTTYGGVNWDFGTIFSFNTSNNFYTDVFNFSQTGTGIYNATCPYNSLVQATNGLFYGITLWGGKNTFGTVYGYKLGATSDSIIHSFDSTMYYGFNGFNGSYANLIQASDSLLYGTNFSDKKDIFGSVYSYNISKNQYNDVHDFGYGTDGAYPQAGLIEIDVISVNLANDTICSGTSVVLKASDSKNYSWFPAEGLSASTGDSVIATPTISTTYTASTIYSNTVYTTTAAIVVKPVPVITVNNASVCPGNSAILLAGGASSYTWQPAKGLNTTIGDSVIAAPTVNTTYTVIGTNNNGCSDTTQSVVSINPAPNKPSITVSVTGDSLISSANSYNQWYFNGQPMDSTRQVLVIKGHTKGWYSVTVTNPANGCSTNSDSTTSINQLSAISEQLSIYPNPFNNNIFIKINSAASNVNEWSLQLTDVLGRQLYSMPSLNYNNEIDLSNLPNAIYFIEISNKKGRTVFPVVKQN